METLIFLLVVLIVLGLVLYAVGHLPIQPWLRNLVVVVVVLIAIVFLAQRFLM